MGERFCLEAVHYDGKRVVFAEQHRVLKSEKHPELRDLDFVRGRMRKAIEEPDFVYQDLAGSDIRIVHYKLEYKINQRNMYTKVVLEKKADIYIVITAYRPDYVKERGKTDLLYGKDE